MKVNYEYNFPPLSVNVVTRLILKFKNHPNDCAESDRRGFLIFLDLIFSSFLSGAIFKRREGRGDVRKFKAAKE